MTEENKKPISKSRKPIVGFLSFLIIGLLTIGQEFAKEVAITSWEFISAQTINIFKERPGLNPISSGVIDPADNKVLSVSCWDTDFSNEDLGGWDFSPYKTGEDGFYTANPEIYTSYWAPEVWLKHQVVTAFSELEFRAEIRSNDNAATLIIALGKEPKKLLRFRVGDGNPQVVTFGRIVPIPGSSSFGFEPLSPAKTLTHPIRKGSSSVVTVKTEYLGGDRLNYHFIVSYISDRPNKGQIDDPFDYSIELLDAKPISRGGAFEKTDFGFAVYKTASIKPLYFKVCPFSLD